MPTFKENPEGMKPSGYKMKYKKSAFPFKSPAKHNGSPQKGTPTPSDTEHNTWHANTDHVKDGGDPNIKKVWNKTQKKWVNSYQPIDLETEKTNKPE